MPNIDRLKKYKKIHMCGIGGVSMSGIAEILVNWGFEVTGSNNVENGATEKLKEAGIKVTIGHHAENVVGADVVVYTAAIDPENIELKTAKLLGIKTIERSDFLGEITRCYNDTSTVAGTHGKSTTTSMLSLCFIEANKDPSIQVGADLFQIKGNYKVGKSEYFVLEACEYVESFLKFSPKSTIILNIDNDHLDYFKNFENIKKAFIKYVKLIPSDGVVVLNSDDSNCLELKNYTKAKVLTYALENENADFIAKNIKFDNDGFASFDVYKNGDFYENIKLSVPGMHNVSNSLGCIAMCYAYGIQPKDIKAALKKFTGAGRRFEFKGKMNGASIYDDYGHHPTEIISTSKALMNKKYNKSWIVFQPHTYSRTVELLDEFAKSLLNFDNIIVIDIYAAREKNKYGISSKDLVEKIKSMGKDAKYMPNFEECVKFLKENVNEDDVVLTQGAGTVTEIGGLLIKS